MNELLPRPWDSVAYGAVCIVCLAIAVFNIGFLSSHCEWVYETTHIEGACGLAVPFWILFAVGFLAVAAYSGWELYRTLREREGAL